MTKIHERAFACACEAKSIDKEQLKKLITRISTEYAEKKNAGIDDIDFKLLVVDTIRNEGIEDKISLSVYKHALGTYFGEKRRKTPVAKYKMHAVRADQYTACVQVAGEVVIEFSANQTLGTLKDGNVRYKYHKFPENVDFDTSDEAIVLKATTVARKAINAERRKPKRRRAA